MSRPPWDVHFLILAHAAAQRATCKRKHVGAIMVDGDKRIVSTGYNGAPAGMPHCIDVGCELKEINGRMSCVRTLHAESNALDRAGSNAKGCTLYCTVIPCYDCAKRIVNADIVRVVFSEYYESRNTKLVVVYLNDVVDLEQHPMRVEILLLCAEDGCSNEGRYSSGYCGIHDM